MAKPTEKVEYGGLGNYHIATIAQLDELPSAVCWSLRFIARVIDIKLQVHKPGDLIDCKMWGQPITMPYEVARHIAIVNALEK